MSAVQGSMSASSRMASRGGGTEKEDPIEKENRAATRKLLENLAKENNPALIENYRSVAAKYGIDLSPYQAAAGITTDTERRNKEMDDYILGAITGVKKAIQQTQTPQSDYDPPANYPTEFTSPSTPTRNMQRQGPRLRINSASRDKEGNWSYSFNNSKLEGEEYVDELARLGEYTSEQAEALKATLYKLKVNDLTSDVDHVVSYKDDKGQVYTHVMLKNGESRVVPAKGKTLFVKDKKGAYELSDKEADALNNAIREGRLDSQRVNSRTGKLFAQLEIRSPGRTDYAGMSQDILEARTAARQRGGPRAAQFTTVSQLFNAVTPDLIALRDKVASKGALPVNIRTFNALDQWAKEESGDPVVAEFKGRVLFLSESLQRTFGGGQGGEWAFELAKDLINPTLAPDAFARRVTAHAEDLNLVASNWKQFGKKDIDFNAEIQKLRNNLAKRQGGESTTSQSPKIAPAGTKAKLLDGTIVTSDGKGGWK